MILLLILPILAVLLLIVTYICYRMAFYSPPRKPMGDKIDIPAGEIYEPYRAKMEAWAREVRAMPHEEFQITSFDGLKLYGNFYEYAPGAPIEIMFHGYRGNAERDLPGGVQRCFKVGHSALLVHQRCSGKSDGHTITFGIREHKDCLAWAEFAAEHFGPDISLILTGISMGASTVLMAGGYPLPANVVGILADCGFSSPKDIIKVVIGKMKLPQFSYFFVKLGARIYGGFDLEETSPEELLRKCTVPVIFYHGESDDFVPCSMSQTNYDACVSKKQLVTIPGAGHGLSYAVDPHTYLRTLLAFFHPDTSA